MPAPGNSRKPRGPKRLTLKNFTLPAAKLPDNYGEEQWKMLASAIDAIHKQTKLGVDLEVLYKAVESLSSKGKEAQQLYDRLRNMCQEHLKLVVLKLNDEGKASATQESDYLPLIDKVWNLHCDMMILIRCIFLSLDRKYVLQTSGLLSIWDMGLHAFGDCVVGHGNVLSRTVSGALGVIAYERSGDAVDRGRLKRLLHMLVDLQCYAKAFEPEFLESTKQFYEVESMRFLEQCEVPAYLIFAEKCLQEERDRADQYLHAATRRPLMGVVETQLVIAHMDAVLEKGFDVLADENRHEDLMRMFRLFSRVECLEKLKESFSLYIKKRGKDIVSNTNSDRDKTMVEDLLAFKRKIDKIGSHAFRNTQLFLDAIRDSFETFINYRHNKPAEMIAKFFDTKLRTGYKDCSEDDLETLFDEVMVLFRFINGKDVFEAFYKNHLARRLLLQKSASDDAERSILSKLKQECGGSFTGKLEGMFKDVNLSTDLTQNFRQSAGKKYAGEIDFSVNVLTASHWPTYAPCKVILPPKILEIQDTFNTFYCKSHRNRKLTWQTSLGHCLLESHFPKGVKDLQISAYQALVILLFNTEETLTCAQIHERTKIELEELKRILQSLACARIRVLTKEPKSRDVAADHKFFVNLKFDDKHRKIRINQIQLRETKAENAQTQEKLFQDRVFAVDAAVVRIMKTRKSMKHTALISELFNQLKFPVKASDLKKRIESLINREYLERDSQDTHTYKYMA
eukprot:m.298258 g.298258  ORF g.298258 m.298258 type:complete len:739 (+) comp16408_c0_seq1:174-2390(+)